MEAETPLANPAVEAGTRQVHALVVYFDGACEPRNPGGVATYGAAAFLGGRLRWQDCAIIGEGPAMSNNVAEYAAALEGLSWALAHTEGPIEMRGDSRLVVEQMKGTWRVKAGRYVPLHHAVRALLPPGRKVAWTWVPRAQNTVADALSKQAYHEKGPRARRDYARILAAQA